MNWKKPNQNIFFIPIPANGQNLWDITEHQRNPKINCKTITLTDIETKQEYTAVILDYLGAYKMEFIPDWIARLVTDKKTITGANFAALLRKRSPDFKKIEKVLFYQLSQI